MQHEYTQEELAKALLDKFNVHAALRSAQTTRLGIGGANEVIEKIAVLAQRYSEKEWELFSSIFAR